MAFVVCYSWSPPDDHTRHGAIYLDQQFYELIYGHCRSEHAPDTVLKQIALLQYKSPTLVIAGEQLGLLDQDLARLAESGAIHAQITELRQVCARAMADGCALTVSGDMYPELWRTDVEPGGQPTSLEFSEPVQGPVRNQEKLRYLVLLPAWTLFIGFVIGAMPAESEKLLSFLDAVVTIVLLLKWIYLDAEEYGVRLHRHFALMMILCPGPLILIPIHFIRSRGWLQGAITTAKAILIFCLLMALKIVAATIAATIFWGQ